MITLLIKLLLKILLLTGFSYTADAQSKQPTTTAISSLRQWRGIYVLPGVPAIDCETWMVVDSTAIWLHPPEVYLDSALYNPSLGSPENILWLESGTGRIQWSSIDSLRLPYTQIDGVPVPISDSAVSVTRTINSSTYTPHTTKQVTVSYNIEISCTASIGSNSSGRVLFQYSTNGGGDWIDAGEVRNSNTVTLAIALQSVTIQSAFINWTIPAGALCRLVPTTSGTTTITWLRGQEVYSGY